MNLFRPPPFPSGPAPRACSRRDPRAGFALLITLTLLAFIVLLLVGLAAYTRVETAVAGNTQRQTQARQNALLALNVALGQLQKYAGPDRCVTATAESVSGVNSQKRRYTGVWDSITTGTEPLAWLVSGSESGTAEDVTQAILPANRRVALAGPRTDGTAFLANGNPGANNVVAALQDIKTVGVPGQTGNVIIGRYAWWVGDQGVKAPVAINDVGATSITYPPYDSAELRQRIRQQVALGAGPAAATGTAIFEPRNSTTGSTPRNATLVSNVTAFNQLAFMKNASGTAIGLTGTSGLRTNYHAWSPNNAAVLANTTDGGLRRDLSLRPDLLGSAFAAWADYDGAAGGTRYMEDPANPATPAPLPEYGTDPLRRRYLITPEVTAGNVVHAIHPVLSFFFIQFNVRRVGGNDASSTVNALEVRARMVAALWNPWSSALVPETLGLEISGLPDITITDSNGGVATINLQSLFGAPSMAVELKFTNDTYAEYPDNASWLPGRVYYWRTSGGDSSLWQTEFYNRTLAASNSVIWTVPANVSYALPAENSVTLMVSGPETQLRVAVKRASDLALLGAYTSPAFGPVFVPAQAVGSNDEYRFGYRFWLIESLDTLTDPTSPSAWMTSAGRDVRVTASPAAIFDHEPDPNQNVGNVGIGKTDRLLDRVMGSSGMSYNEDVPVFELPRAPILSLGSLQHLQLANQRPFTIGNPWGKDVTIGDGVPANALFDRFFFSGLAAPVTAALKPATNSETTPEDAAAADTAALAQPAPRPLPNPLLLALPRKAGGAATTLGDVLGKTTGFADATEGFSSKYLVQTGAFNLNSVNAAAWRAMLRATRFANGVNFVSLNASAGTGTNGDSSTSSTTPADAVFFRFPQSAQETFEADSPVTIFVDGVEVPTTYAATTNITGADPDPTSTANTHLFRRGMRALSAADTVAFANAIAARMTEKQKDSGPYRSLEEFLSPLSLFADASGRDRSLLETAIEDAQLNAGIAEFSSQWLTQADVITALAPVLFPRSDTFVIRTYGEAVNPVTTAVESRAWCEALVQRLPDYFDSSPTGDADAATAPANLTSDLNKTYGRRFKVISFRWLTRSDI